jgi:ABC-2 type transport system ATP-binding protein
MTLSAEAVSVAYGGVQALHAVTLRVARGEVVGLLGPNGAGKSTLLRVLATLQLPDAGRVSIAGVDALEQPDIARAHLGYLPQEFGFPPALTADELLDHVARLRGFADAPVRRDAVDAMLERTNLTAMRSRATRALSGGMRQRLGIAMALLGAPDVLIVDEPTVALDPAERHRVYDLLMELGADRAVLVSTHLVADVEALCHHIVILHHGRVVRAGDPAKLSAALHGRVFRASVPRSAVLDARRMLPVVRETAIRGAVELTVVADAAPDARFAAHAPTLDDVFAEATA